MTEHIHSDGLKPKKAAVGEKGRGSVRSVGKIWSWAKPAPCSLGKPHSRWETQLPVISSNWTVGGNFERSHLLQNGGNPSKVKLFREPLLPSLAWSVVSKYIHSL